MPLSAIKPCDRDHRVIRGVVLCVACGGIAALASAAGPAALPDAAWSRSALQVTTEAPAHVPGGQAHGYGWHAHSLTQPDWRGIHAAGAVDPLGVVDAGKARLPEVKAALQLQPVVMRTPAVAGRMESMDSEWPAASSSARPVWGLQLSVDW